VCLSQWETLSALEGGRPLDFLQSHKFIWVSLQDLIYLYPGQHSILPTQNDKNMKLKLTPLGLL
jgi:hypothetical protein